MEIQNSLTTDTTLVSYCPMQDGQQSIGLLGSSSIRNVPDLVALYGKFFSSKFINTEHQLHYVTIKYNEYYEDVSSFMAYDYREIGSNTTHPGNTNINNHVLQLLTIASVSILYGSQQNSLQIMNVQMWWWWWRRWGWSGENNRSEPQEREKRRMVWVPKTYWSEFTNDSNSFWRG